MIIASNFPSEKIEPKESSVPFGLHSCGSYPLPRGNVLTDNHRKGTVS